MDMVGEQTMKQEEEKNEKRGGNSTVRSKK